MGAKTGLYEVKSAALRTYPRNSGMSEEEKKNRGKRLEERDDDVANTITSHQLDSIVTTHALYPRSSKTGKGGSGPLNKKDGTSYCLDTENTQAVEENSNIRRLTPTETERLQGFPDNWTEGCSDTQRYKQTGNAVSVPVVKSIMERLYNDKSNR